MAKVKLKKQEKAINTVLPKINQKIALDTLFVSDPKNLRLKKYQDSLRLSSKKRLNPNPVISVAEFEKVRYKGAAGAYKEKGINPIGFREFSKTPYRASEPVFAKPKQPVEYKKSEYKKEEPIKQIKKEQIVSEKRQNEYEGSPVYSPGAGSGMPSALVGFRSKSGEVTYIKPEDYKRFSVPEYGKKFIESKDNK